MRACTEPVSRTRRSLAATLDVALEPEHAVRVGLRTWPRMPRANREAVTEPLREIASLLRDSDVVVPDRVLPEIMAFASHPSSPAFGRSPVRAGFLAHALADELRAGSARAA